jgi:hypothetical protein
VRISQGLPIIILRDQLQLASIGDAAFQGCALASASIPEGVLSIGDGAFADCSSLASLALPSTLGTIGHEAFRWSKLTVVDLPPSVWSIGDNAFYTLGLIDLTVRASTPPEAGYYIVPAAVSMPALSIRVPAGSFEAYKSAYRWSDYASIIKPIL